MTASMPFSNRKDVNEKKKVLVLIELAIHIVEICNVTQPGFNIHC